MITKEDAIKILESSYILNPGPWKEHSYVVARCAYIIAKNCNLDENKAYIYGLLHDIGRRFGITYLKHTIDGYDYCLYLGISEAARICLTHSFADKDLNSYIGMHDVTHDEKMRINSLLDSFQYDDYDRLIQVCDALALPTGPVDMIIRMEDVKSRYGYYPIAKWNKHLELKEYFEKKLGMDITSFISKYY